MDVGVDATRGEDLALTGDDLGRHADRDVDALLDVGVAGLADGEDPAVPQADVGLVDARVVDDQRVGDDGVGDVLRPRDPGVLTHAVADHLAATEHGLVTVDGEVALHLREQVGVAEADGIAGGGAVEFDVLAALDLLAHDAFSFLLAAASSGPSWRLLNP